MRFKFGAFTFLDLGDLSGNTLGALVCPRNLVGQVSVYLVSHHGDYDTDIPAVLTALRPQVAVMNNGTTKGGDPASIATLLRQPGLELWQLHASKNRGARNTTEAFIANVDAGASGYAIRLTASEDGRFTLVNSRTGFSKRYQPRAER